MIVRRKTTIKKMFEVIKFSRAIFIKTFKFQTIKTMLFYFPNVGSNLMLFYFPNVGTNIRTNGEKYISLSNKSSVGVEQRFSDRGCTSQQALSMGAVSNGMLHTDYFDLTLAGTTTLSPIWYTTSV